MLPGSRTLGRLVAALALLSTASLAAQPVVTTSTRDRVQSMYRVRGDAKPRVEVAFSYTPSTWKARFEEFLDQSGPLAMQIGGDGFANLDSNVPLRIGGVDVPAGIHRARLRRDAEQRWSLTLLDADRSRKLGDYPGEEADPPFDLRIPFEVTQLPVVGEADPLLRIDFDPDPARLGRSHLRIRWAQREARIEVVADTTTERPRGLVDIPVRPWAGETTTGSGLIWTQVRAGRDDGMRPAADADVVVRYTMWRPDGQVADRTQEGRRLLKIPALVPGMQEALMLMEEGAVHHVLIPSRLAYGSKGAGPNIPPGTDLILRLELVEIR